ncbi:hypothetical protein L6R49_27690, partial [Myxococcota bacterium]|nr:hypothetical protein [Myxococcota bacterium]
MIRRLAAFLALLTAALLLPTEARLSQVFYEELPLRDVVQRWGTVLIVRQDTPPTRKLDVPYTLTNNRGEVIRTSYPVDVARVIVEEVIRAEGEPPKPGAALELYSPHTLTLFNHGLRYDLTGTSRSFSLEIFYGEDLFTAQPADARFIVFVREPNHINPGEGPTQDAWRAMADATRGMLPLTVAGAVLPVSRRQEVEALLNPPA